LSFTVSVIAQIVYWDKWLIAPYSKVLFASKVSWENLQSVSKYAYNAQPYCRQLVAALYVIARTQWEFVV